MRIYRILTLSFGLKIIIFILCYSLCSINKLCSFPAYFNPILSPAAQTAAVQSAGDVNARNALQLTGLMFAALDGMFTLAQALFDAGADLNLIEPKSGDTALHFALKDNPSDKSMDVGKYLADVFANTRIKNKMSATPLHFAVSIQTLPKRSKMVEILVKNGADINAQDKDGNTFLHLNVDLNDSYFVGPFLREWAPILNLDLKNNQGHTAQQAATYRGFFDLAAKFNQPMQRIIAGDAYIPNGLNGIMLAIIRSDIAGLKKMIAANRAVVNLVSRDEYKYTPLHLAMIYENESAINILLDNSASLTAQDRNGDTPAHYLVRIDNLDTRMKTAQKLLGDNVALVNAKNKNDNNVLHYLVQYNDPKLLQYVIGKFGSSLDYQAKNKKFQTPYSLSIHLKRNTITQILNDAQQKYLIRM